MLPVEIHQNAQGRRMFPVQGVHHGCNKKVLPADGKYFSLVLLACQIDAPSCGFFKNVSSIERVEPWFFVTFNIILKDIFPENFIEFPQVVQKICRNTLSILANFINFNQFFEFFDITLLQRN